MIVSSPSQLAIDLALDPQEPITNMQGLNIYVDLKIDPSESTQQTASAPQARESDCFVSPVVQLEEPEAAESCQRWRGESLDFNSENVVVQSERAEGGVEAGGCDRIGSSAHPEGESLKANPNEGPVGQGWGKTRELSAFLESQGWVGYYSVLAKRNLKSFGADVDFRESEGSPWSSKKIRLPLDEDLNVGLEERPTRDDHMDAEPGISSPVARDFDFGFVARPRRIGLEESYQGPDVEVKEPEHFDHSPMHQNIVCIDLNEDLEEESYWDLQTNENSKNPSTHEIEDEIKDLQQENVESEGLLEHELGPGQSENLQEEPVELHEHEVYARRSQDLHEESPMELEKPRETLSPFHPNIENVEEPPRDEAFDQVIEEFLLCVQNCVWSVRLEEYDDYGVIGLRREENEEFVEVLVREDADKDLEELGREDTDEGVEKRLREAKELVELQIKDNDKVLEEPSRGDNEQDLEELRRADNDKDLIETRERARLQMICDNEAARDREILFGSDPGVRLERHPDLTNRRSGYTDELRKVLTVLELPRTVNPNAQYSVSSIPEVKSFDMADLQGAYILLKVRARLTREEEQQAGDVPRTDARPEELGQDIPLGDLLELSNLVLQIYSSPARY